MRVDLHNHTPLCNHALGEPKDYIKRAIEQGVDVYGFSCHAPMDFDEGYRMSFAQLPEYIAHIEALRGEFCGQIKILVGLEADFILHKESLLDLRVVNADVDYLIGSVHFLNEWGFDNPDFIGMYRQKDLKACWEEYLHAIKASANSGHFQIIGHIDLLKIFNNHMPNSLESTLLDTLSAIKESGLVVEVNASGLRKSCKEPYPSLKILRKIKELNIPITFGSDAHALEHVGFGYEEVRNMCVELGFKEVSYFLKKERIVCQI